MTTFSFLACQSDATLNFSSLQLFCPLPTYHTTIWSFLNSTRISIQPLLQLSIKISANSILSLRVPHLGWFLQSFQTRTFTNFIKKNYFLHSCYWEFNPTSPPQGQFQDILNWVLWGEQEQSLPVCVGICVNLHFLLKEKLQSY